MSEGLRAQRQSGRPLGGHRLVAVRRNELGVSMLEVLITLILLSIGFLAAASMQVQSMRTNQDAFQRAQALVVLGNVMDRMSSNPQAVADGLFDNKTTGTLSSPNCQSSGCTPAQLAALALFEFSASFQPLKAEQDYIPLLPPNTDGTPAIGTISAPVDGVYTLSATWQRLDGGEYVDEVVSVDFVP